MSPIDKRLAGVRQFLEREILPDVAGEKRSELRAAIKLLAEISGELDGAVARAADEATEILDLSVVAMNCMPDGSNGILLDRHLAVQRELPGAATSLSVGESVRQRARLLVGDVAVALVERQTLGTASAGATDAVSAIYRCLGEHAGARIPFQSVFQNRLYPIDLAGEPS